MKISFAVPILLSRAYNALAQDPMEGYGYVANDEGFLPPEDSVEYIPPPVESSEKEPLIAYDGQDAWKPLNNEEQEVYVYDEKPPVVDGEDYVYNEQIPEVVYDYAPDENDPYYIPLPQMIAMVEACLTIQEASKLEKIRSLLELEHQ